MTNNADDNRTLNKPLVSVVIPAYNVSRYIDETLSALESQTLDSIEIICVDDGSKDNTFQLIQKHAASDGRVKAIHQDNSGAGAARNNGLSFVRGEWVAFLDADDIYQANFLETMVCYGANYSADIVFCDMDRFIEKSGNTEPYLRITKAIGGPGVSTSDCEDKLFQLSYVAPFNKLYKTSFVLENGLRFQQLSNCNDMFFTCTALANAKKLAIVRIPLVSYRVTNGPSIQDDFVRRPTKEKCLCVYHALSKLREYCSSRNLLSDDSWQSLDNLTVINSFSATTKALGHDALLEDVFDYYQHALISEWQVSKPDKTAGFEVRSKYELMVNSNAEQFAWVYKEAGKSRSGGLARKALLGAKTTLVILRNGFH